MKTVLSNEHVHSKFGEGPLWDQEMERLFWVDIMDKRIQVYYPKTNQEESYKLPNPPMALVKYSKHELIVIMQDGFYLYNLQKQTLQEILKPEGLNEKLLLNDSKCDPQGRIWVGSVNDDFRLFKEKENAPNTEFKGNIASLYRLNRNLDIKLAKEKVTLSNGLDWDPVRNLMYYIDSATQSVFQFQYDPFTGQISKEDIVYTFEESDGLPDGMTIDQDGMLWVALFKGGVVAKVNPFEKKWVDSITLPTRNVTSCVFGGEDLKTLYITTAAELPTEYEENQYTLGGCLFSVKLEVGGYQTNTFQGNLKESIYRY
ncbi:SMP-30/gluconolactonase/LRE family protein [Priestia endophytica]|uniref:SMP-30/gluconolactonase/LRE family protein n=1 Tax=Priestia endophytica TaxID=135735 RepID=UPI000F51F56F|nr:SMP-30/gluconolactonase/LRE family protein [Priestia endophytica]RPK14835.1 Gluconolactonase [Priestia endophytica]